MTSQTLVLCCCPGLVGSRHYSSTERLSVLAALYDGGWRSVSTGSQPTCASMPGDTQVVLKLRKVEVVGRISLPVWVNSDHLPDAEVVGVFMYVLASWRNAAKACALLMRHARPWVFSSNHRNPERP